MFLIAHEAVLSNFLVAEAREAREATNEGD